MFHDAERENDDLELHDIPMEEVNPNENQQQGHLTPVLGDFTQNEKKNVATFLREHYDAWAATKTVAYKKRAWLQILVAHCLILFIAVIYFNVIFNILIEPVRDLHHIWERHNSCTIEDAWMDVQSSDTLVYSIAKASIGYTPNPPSTHVSYSNATVYAVATKSVQAVVDARSQEEWLSEVLLLQKAGATVTCFVSVSYQSHTHTYILFV
jgi:hypothetical protein